MAHSIYIGLASHHSLQEETVIPCYVTYILMYKCWHGARMTAPEQALDYGQGIC